MDAILEIRGLKTYFETAEGQVRAVDDLTISLQAGRTLGLVGESGSGKSVTSLSIMQLLPEAAARIAGGEIVFLGQDLVRLPRVALQQVRGRDIGMIFQEPGTSLNPVFTVGDQVMEAIRLHQTITPQEARQRTLKLFEEVGIPEPERRIDSYPHEMSGGQKQRVMIAMALSCNPKLLIADEPTTALDVTIQKQILELIGQLRDQRGMSVLFITHDLGVIAEIADDVAVMYRGRLVEQGSVEAIFSSPQHPYTKGLIACRPRPRTVYRRLPVVSDFMEVRTLPSGEVELKEKTMTAERLTELCSRGRARLLPPEYLGRAVPPETLFVPAGTAPLLAITDLKVHYPIKKGLLRTTVGHVRAVDGVSFSVHRGQTLGLVGESGCGKTTTGRAIVRLTAITAGQVLFAGADLTRWQGNALRTMRSRIQIVFQDPYSSLNPRMTVEAMLVEPMLVHGRGTTRQDRRDRAAALLEEVGLEASHLRRFPHEFSGGQRQRLSIARALAVEPEFLICDESVSALDVSVQAQVLNLLKDLQDRRGLTYIFISHDLGVVKFMSDMMAVMNAGQIVEYGPANEIYESPKVDYTRRLIAAIPDDSLAHIRERRERRALAGMGNRVS